MQWQQSSSDAADVLHRHIEAAGSTRAVSIVVLSIAGLTALVLERARLYCTACAPGSIGQTDLVCVWYAGDPSILESRGSSPGCIPTHIFSGSWLEIL